MNFDSWKSVLVLAALFFISVSTAAFYSRPLVQSISATAGTIMGYYGVMMGKALLVAWLARYLSRGSVSFFLALSLAVFTLFFQQASADLLNALR